MITGIFTAEATTLTIETTEVVLLVQKGREDSPTRLKVGTNTVEVAAGVYKVESTRPVVVTSTSPETIILTTDRKEGTFPDQNRLTEININPDDIRDFFADSRSMPAPAAPAAPRKAGG